MRICCPHCGEASITRTSKRPSPTLYEVYAQCINPACGWGGKIYVEFAKTLTLSRDPNTDIRIPMEPGHRRACMEQLAALNG
ncbi:ogr/Delta-like zinc finger family protein [Salinicola acroporae]|uniref:Transcriptional regulator n=1 Tax=Salinicola acroporae TaxID=1541440 RepID=A0ABT6I0D0_9GAMM|nr:ogr/Delta-like zinc finger family protein [Salinicola acroporae]MDH4571126.1 transcriptional regulator [Salinicola acroporae]